MGYARFGKVLSAMVTPFREDGSLDAEGAAALARWLVTKGHDGLVLAGTTGEAPTQTDEEKLELWRTVRAAVDVPLVAGVGTNDTRHSVEAARQAQDCGVDGLLVVVPYYNRPPQAGIEAHMRAVAQAVDLPIMMYDVPSRTGLAMTVETIAQLAREVPNIAALKDARGKINETAQIVEQAPADFDVYSGDDSSLLHALGVGAVGIVGVATGWAGTYFHDLVAAFEKGDHRTAREINARLLDSYDFEADRRWTQASSVKTVLSELGLPSGPTRLPIPPVPEEARERARAIINELELRV